MSGATFSMGKKKGFSFLGYQGVDPVITRNDGHRRAEKTTTKKRHKVFGLMFVYDMKKKRMTICSGTCLSNTPGWMDGRPSGPSPSSSFILLHRNRETSQQKEETGDHTPKGWLHSVGLKGRKERRKEGRIV